MATAPAPQSGRLHVSIFGGPTLRDGAAEIPLSQYQAALLALVFCHGRQGITRSRLIWLLWEEDANQQSRHRLSQLIYAVSRKVAPRELVVGRGEIVGAGDDAASDLTLFEDLLHRKQVGGAAALLRKDLLPLLTASLPELEDWRAAKAIALRSRLRDAAAALWSEAEGVANWALAREAAETLFGLDPHSETYLRCVMKTRALCGAHEEAEAAYRSWAELVPPSVSVGAADLLTALGTWRERGPLLGATPAEPAFVGRRKEAAALRNAAKPASSDEVRVVLVTGEPGIGKTRLAAEICRDLAVDGIRVARSSCSALEEGIPLNPLIDILKDERFKEALYTLDEPWRSVIRDFLPDHAQDPVEVPYLEPSAISRRLYEAVRRLLSAISLEGAVLWIDDFQWVDHTTAAALEFALRRWDRGRLTVLLSARTPDESSPTHGHRWINALRGRSTSIKLDDLSADEAVALASSILGSAFPTASRDQLLGLTGNVPLYIVEVAHELAEGRMQLGDAGDSANALPVKIQAVVDDRLSLLRPVERWMLEVIAVGYRLPIEAVAATLRESQGVLLDALDRLMALRLIATERGVLSCTHDLIRQGIYSSMTQLKQSALHRRIAESLLLNDPDQDPSHLALHFDRAQMPPEAFRFAKAAADRAEEAGAAQEAIRFLRIARRNAPDEREATALLAREAGVCFRQTAVDRALPLLTIAEQELLRHGDYGGALECRLKRVWVALEVGALPHAEAVYVTDRLLEDCATASLWEPYVKAVETRLGIMERANDVTELRRCMTLLERVRSEDIRVRCIMNSVLSLDLLFGDGTKAHRAAAEAYRIATESNFRDLQDGALHRLLLVHGLGGTLNTDGGRGIVEECLRRAAASDALRTRYMLLESTGVWSLESGDLDTADRHLRQAQEIYRTAPDISDRVNVFGNLAELSATRGRFDDACEHYTKAFESLRPQDHWRLREVINAGLGYCALERGDLRLAKECEARVTHTTECYFDPWVIVLFKVTLMRRRGDHQRALQYVSDIARLFEDRMRLVVIKLRLLEARLSKGHSPAHSQRLVNWLLEETARLRLPLRHAEAAALGAGARF